jgi:dihydroorotate dehydrogenase (fumarate)
MTDLRTTYLGLDLRSPLVASSGPFTGDPDRLPSLVDAGASAIVLPSLFQEQIEHETADIDRLYTVNADSFGEATSFLPELDDYNTGADTYLDLVETARRRVDVPLIASLNGTTLGGWLRYARLLEDAGADALELNLYAVAADPTSDGRQIEAEQLELVAMVVEDVGIPVAVKISPYYSALAHFVLALQEAGAAGVVMFNRFYAPDLDLETLDVRPSIQLSRSSELTLPLRWIGITREYLTMSIAASTGVHEGIDAAKLLLAGADVVMTTSALLIHGPGHLATIERELVTWMSAHEYRTVGELRGAARRESSADPAAYERANYIGNLTTYATRFREASRASVQWTSGSTS